MSVDSSQLASSAVTIEDSSSQGSVAPPRFEQLIRGEAEAPSQAQERQPAQREAGVASGGQPQGQPDSTPPSQPTEDFEARLRAAEAARSQAEAEAQQNRAVLERINSFAAQNQAQQERQNRINMVLAQAENMPSAEANSFLRDQMASLVSQTEMTLQQQFSQRENDYQQQIRTVAAPSYADHLITTLGLPAEAKEELVSLGDPDLMYRQAPAIKRRWDELARYRQGQTQANQQLARSQEVAAMANAGLTQIGGQTGGGTITFEASDDPDIRAMQTLAVLRAAEQGRLQNY